MLEQSHELAKQLKLFGMMETLDLRAAEATQNGWGYREFLGALLSDEKQDRDNRATQRRLKQARFRVNACEEKIDTTSKRNLTRTQVRELMQLEFLKNSRNVLLSGPTGVGKTYLASAIGNQACRQGYTCIFVGVNELTDRIEISRAEGTWLRYRDKLVKTDCLILDDLGIRALPQSMIQDLYDILEERYQDKCTIITTQLPMENWNEVIPDDVAREAIIDRLIHGAYKIDLKGESMRKKRTTDSMVDKA